jgi:hypothetical protein
MGRKGKNQEKTKKLLIKRKENGKTLRALDTTHSSAAAERVRERRRRFGAGM